MTILIVVDPEAFDLPEGTLGPCGSWEVGPGGRVSPPSHVDCRNPKLISSQVAEAKPASGISSPSPSGPENSFTDSGRYL